MEFYGISPLIYDMLYWLVVEPYPSEKYESVGVMKFPISGKIKFMFQTTNQYMYICVYNCDKQI